VATQGGPEVVNWGDHEPPEIEDWVLIVLVVALTTVSVLLAHYGR